MSYGAIGQEDEYDSDDVLRELIAGIDEDDDELLGGAIGVDEIVGLRELIGQDEGAAPASASRKLARLANKMKALRAIDPNAVDVATQVDRRRRRLVMGSPATPVTAGDTVAITLQPQRLFRTERVMVPSEIAPYFTIEDVKVGQQSQFAATGVIAATTWSEVAINADVHFDSADIGNTVTIFVTNTDASDHTFYSTWFGTATVR